MGSGGATRRATMFDIAASAGVSQSLVSIVMRGVPGASAGTRARILAMAEELGYRPDSRAQMLRRSSSRLIGVVFDVQQDFHGELIAGLYRATAPLGYQLTLSAVTPDRDERSALDGLLGDRCEALILLGPESSPAALSTVAGTVPLVAVARAVRLQAVDVVRSADAQGVRLAIDHLVALGHRRIVHIDGGRAPGAADRRRGYREGMKRHGLGDEIRVHPGGPMEDDGAAAARALLPGELPTAVVVFNDRSATGFLEVLRGAGMNVPGDISVIGNDDSRLARMSFVDLTTIAQDVDRLCELAVMRAIDRATGVEPAGPREQVAIPRLVIRSTTAPPADR